MNIDDITIGSRWKIKKEWSSNHLNTENATIVITKIDKTYNTVYFDYKLGKENKKRDIIRWYCRLDDSFLMHMKLLIHMKLLKINGDI